MDENSKELSDQRRQALSNILELYRKDYQEHCTIFSELDRKAQATTAMAGIFLAAAFAFAKTEELAHLVNLLGVAGPLFLGLPILMLIIVVGASIWATAVRTCPLSPDPTALNKATDDVLRLSASETQLVHFDNLICQEISLWKPIISRFFEINRSKSRAIIFAQIVLALAIIAVALLLFFILSASVVLAKNPVRAN